MFDGSLVRSIDFARIVAPVTQGAQRFVGIILDHFQQPGIGTKYMLANIGA